jgi:hypothetical protein
MTAGQRGWTSPVATFDSNLQQTSAKMLVQRIETQPCSITLSR